MTIPIITPAPPTDDDLRAATERKQAEVAEQARRERQAEADLARRAPLIAAEAQARAARLAELAAKEVATTTAAGEAWNTVDELRRTKVYPQDFAQDIKAEELLDLAGWTIPEIQDPLARTTIQQFVDQVGRHKKHLIITGSLGAGKTSAAIAAGHALVRKGFHTRLVTATGFINSTYPDAEPARPGESAERFKRRLIRTEVLIVDDLGKGLEPGEQASRWVQDHMTDLIGMRATAGRTTIFTTNFHAPQLRAIYDDRVMSRLGMDAVAADMVGPDLRQPLTDF